MPRAITCLHDGKEITVEAALELRKQAKLGHRKLIFLCVECHERVRPHKEGGQAQAHFEHLHRNSSCPRSDPERS